MNAEVCDGVTAIPPQETRVVVAIGETLRDDKLPKVLHPTLFESWARYGVDICGLFELIVDVVET
jgi:hypothetical protein